MKPLAPTRNRMNLKKLIWLGMLFGSFVGGYVPTMWGADVISLSSLLGSFIGSFVGIWAAYKLNQMIDG